MVIVYEQNGKQYTGFSLTEAKAKANADKIVINESFAKPMENIKKVEVKEIKKEVKKKLTEADVWELNKSEQCAMIEKLGLKPAKYEKDRVKQILKNQWG